MKNLINWILGNKKFLIDYSVNFYTHKDSVKNDIKWAKDKSELICDISKEYKVVESRVENVEILELPSFSRALNFINEDKNCL